MKIYRVHRYPEAREEKLASRNRRRHAEKLHRYLTYSGKISHVDPSNYKFHRHESRVGPMDDEGVSAPKYVAVSKDKYGAKALFSATCCVSGTRSRGRGGGLPSVCLSCTFEDTQPGPELPEMRLGQGRATTLRSRQGQRFVVCALSTGHPLPAHSVLGASQECRVVSRLTPDTDCS